MSVGGRLEQEGYGTTYDPQARVSVNLEQDIEVQPDLIRIAPDVRLDFGGFGKGWLIDKVGALLREAGITAFIVNGGGDILVGGDFETLYIEHPLQPTEHIGSVAVRNGSLASSSRQKRTWKTSEGISKTHIVSPTQGSDNTLLSVHVRAQTALQADTFGTVFLLADQRQRRTFSQDSGLQFLEIGPDLSYWQTAGFGFQSNA